MKKQRDLKIKGKSPARDEWGDEGKWITLVDFTKIKRGGVPAREVLRALIGLNKHN